MLVERILSLSLLCYQSVAVTSSIPGLQAHSVSNRNRLTPDSHLEGTNISMASQPRSSLQPRSVPVYRIHCFGDGNKKNHCLMNCQCRNNNRGRVSCGLTDPNSSKRLKKYLAGLRATCPSSCVCDEHTDLLSQSSSGGHRLVAGSPHVQPSPSRSSISQPGSYLAALMQRAPIALEDPPCAPSSSIQNRAVEQRSASASNPKSLEPRLVPRDRLKAPHGYRIGSDYTASSVVNAKELALDSLPSFVEQPLT